MILRVGTVYGDEALAALYTYAGDDLGVHVAPEIISFRLWAPTATAANVLLYHSGHLPETPTEVPMTRGTLGTWVATVSREHCNEFYNFQVKMDDLWTEAVDPYAHAVGANGGRGQIVNLQDTNPPNWLFDKGPLLQSPTDAILYELHIRDVSMHPASGITHKGKFLGLTETGTRTRSGLKTGLDHIRDLGVTHVHLLPSFDYKTVDETSSNTFNWGYDPLNYNVPEGSYATDPYDGRVRIKEFKQMVQTLHKYNLGVIMDVVYNHTFDALTSNLHQLVPGYYYRTDAAGNLCDGSACGNETASERDMVRKLMIDSVVYWATEYHIDGFRFDLMGLHDIDTMNLIRAALDKVNPQILIYGEGWTGGDTVLPYEKRALKSNAPFLDDRIAVFSDDMRDGLKGSVFIDKAAGYVNGNLDRTMDVRFGIVAATEHPQVDVTHVHYSELFWAKQPTQTVTYASAHDNLTLWDKLIKTHPNASTRELEAMNRLSALIVLTSQGIPFFQAGEEMARTKGGDETSYASPDAVNQLDWYRKGDFLGLYEYYKGLIALRKKYPGFRLRKNVRERLQFLPTKQDGLIAYTIEGTPKMAVVLNPYTSAKSVTLPCSGWDVLVTGQQAGITPLYSVTDVVEVGACSGVVLVRSVAANRDAPSKAPIISFQKFYEQSATVAQGNPILRFHLSSKETTEEGKTRNAAPQHVFKQMFPRLNVRPSHTLMKHWLIASLVATGSVSLVMWLMRRKK